MAEEKKKEKEKKHPKNTSAANLYFKPCKDVKGLRFGGQLLVKTFTVRCASALELSQLINVPPSYLRQSRSLPFPSTTTYVPTNFTILAQRAWHTLTLGLGTKKSKVVVFVFESEGLKSTADRQWPPVIPLGDVNRKLVRGLTGCELSRFKFRKGSLTFYVYAVRRREAAGFGCTDDLRRILEAVAALKDFVDHTAMLALPSRPSISFSNTVAMAI
ncbi:hypothetical protein Cni_G29151 [Canna indica]|uniref:DUF7851 domain-containing protein n=1 Tax=Canna indica TaxID=4628 RepID=A0AAQ3QPD2_9LILI|nr:hypothetical protein Cni_G29151 [Canna indica]